MTWFYPHLLRRTCREHQCAYIISQDTAAISQDTAATLNCAISVRDKVRIEPEAAASIGSNPALGNVTKDESNDIANVDFFDIRDVNVVSTVHLIS